MDDPVPLKHEARRESECRCIDYSGNLLVCQLFAYSIRTVSSTAVGPFATCSIAIVCNSRASWKCCAASYGLFIRTARGWKREIAHSGQVSSLVRNEKRAHHPIGSVRPRFALGLRIECSRVQRFSVR